MTVLSLTTVVSAALVGVNNRMFKIEREIRTTFPRRGDDSDSDGDGDYGDGGGGDISGSAGPSNDRPNRASVAAQAEVDASYVEGD
jgi:hypothetical protein